MHVRVNIPLCGRTKYPFRRTSSRGRRAGLESVAIWSQPTDSTRSIASQYLTAYHYGFMLTSPCHLSEIS